MSHFRWYPTTEETVVPWNARYDFPSQANKTVKSTPRIPPKNGSVFTPGNMIRLEYPASDFVNPINTTLVMDVTLVGWGDPNSSEITRIQNNIQSIFQRWSELYGSSYIEDIYDYNLLVRMLTEQTATNQFNSIDQTCISEGIGGFAPGVDGDTLNPAGPTSGLVNVRQNYIQGIQGPQLGATTTIPGGGKPTGTIPNNYFASGAQAPTNGASYCTVRYQFSPALGMSVQDKLLPTKFMASQFAYQIYLEQPSACIYSKLGNTNPLAAPPTYYVTNVNLIPEALSFDSSYDVEFVRGLQKGGVPIKFSSWNTFKFTTQGSSVLQYQIQERSRSVKALFGLQTRSPPDYSSDSHATFFDTANSQSPTTMQQYQYRIGNRFYPASPVQLNLQMGSNICNGGCEAYVEAQKAFNTLGDYRLSTSVNKLRWAVPGQYNSAGTVPILGEYDYDVNIQKFVNGTPVYKNVQRAGLALANIFSGTVGSSCYISALDLETSNGIEISGLNAEEQSDIQFLAYWSNPQAIGFTFTFFSYHDRMIVLKENNVMELIQ